MDEALIIDQDDAQSEEELAVRQWRTQQLQSVGLSWLLAHVFAMVVDWHDVARLVDGGCPPELALDIVR